jgi:hypothetical protein
MKPASPLSLPVEGNSYWIFRENRLLVVITLIQPHAFTGLNVNSRDYFHAGPAIVFTNNHSAKTPDKLPKAKQSGCLTEPIWNSQEFPIQY